jgi:hypothetical protein
VLGFPSGSYIINFGDETNNPIFNLDFDSYSTSNSSLINSVNLSKSYNTIGVFYINIYDAGEYCYKNKTYIPIYISNMSMEIVQSEATNSPFSVASNKTSTVFNISLPTTGLNITSTKFNTTPSSSLVLNTTTNFFISFNASVINFESVQQVIGFLNEDLDAGYCLSLYL